MDTQNPVVRLSHIKKSFGKNEVLKDISLDVMPGEVVAVIGPSGGGKSTLLRCATLLETFDSGDLLYDDMTVARTGDSGKAEYAKSDVLRRAKMKFGLVFQNYNPITPCSRTSWMRPSACRNAARRKWNARRVS